jgi:4-phospho-D-threonate 3-dehydrogenase / 4-phospho-D-erythronate 3-dehydrogenase
MLLMDIRSSIKPTIAITVGDPAGVGAEVTLKALADPQISGLARWVIVGDECVLTEAGKVCCIPSASLPASIYSPRVLSKDTPIIYGTLNASYGAAAVEYVRIATEMCLHGEADAMVTAPINKEAVVLSERSFSGHTEYIAELCGVRSSRMLLASEQLSIIHVSTHISLAQACKLNTERIIETIQLGHQAMKLLGHAQPRIAVSGLNPHAGEHGLFGSEDEEYIVPAVNACAQQGINCTGPHAPDSIFLKAFRGQYDLVVAMYHDQGHIPMKLLNFDSAVNISLGIPIIRTSVDHGTAFDIAGTGQADATNMKTAMKMAVSMAVHKRMEAPSLVTEVEKG